MPSRFAAYFVVASRLKLCIDINELGMSNSIRPNGRPLQTALFYAVNLLFREWIAVLRER